ncbi:MAG: tRNA (N(6)-L-threonylcarbamoyladenosine(37)-C(2))-methylthiotransferase [Candidatus Marsarchaeota archaeon]|nr:tRNA (N(6)-L-threonylcarbamoyladenosine(37)-C(2))-methylthiotransferase [Candidatus Marsarchaeota archaeon]
MASRSTSTKDRPGTPSVAFEVFGCSMNKADADSARQHVENKGFRITNTRDAQTVVIFSCSVRNETEDKIISHIQQLIGDKKRVVVTSCLANTRPGKILSEAPQSTLLIGGDNPELVDALTAAQGSVIYGSQRLEPSNSDGLVYTVKIAQGCTSNCKFCITKLARPYMWSRPAAQIIDAVDRAVKNGAVEIQLSSMDNADYFSPPSTRLPQLVAGIIDRVKGDYKLRIGMMNPKGTLQFLNDMTRLFESDNMYRFLHIPIQSGSVKVVTTMARNYEPFEVAKVLGRIKQSVRDTTLATDIMVGYPTEDEEAFEETIRLIESAVFDKVHVFRFTPRPHTPAAKLVQIPEQTKKMRSKLAAQVARDIQMERNARLIGSQRECLVTSSIGQSRLEARLDNYIKVYLPYSRRLLGKRLLVTISGCTPDHLMGEMVR